MTKRVFCTYFDHRYLSRGIVMISSLREQGAADDVWVLCMTDQCHRALSELALPNVRPVSLSEIEAAYPALLEAKTTRSTLEYYFTCTPQIIRMVFDHVPDAETVAYLDADLYFFDKVSAVFEEIGDAPVAIIPHHFTSRMRSLERFGYYNVGWVSFSRSEEGLRCLHWWCERCIEWCFDRVDGNRFADQRYLERFSEISPNTKVLQHKGLNAAPWNLGNYYIRLDAGRVMVDDDPIVFFHFHGVRRALGLFYFDGHRRFHAPHNDLIRNHIYKPYVEELNRADRVAEDILGHGNLKKLSRGGLRFLQIDISQIYTRTRDTAIKLFDIVQGRPILVWNSRVY